MNKSLFFINGNYRKWDGYQWQTITTVTPTKIDFETYGMNDLSILNRKPTSFTQQMINDGVLGGGKVFKTTVELDKYFDLIGLNVK